MIMIIVIVLIMNLFRFMIMINDLLNQWWSNGVCDLLSACNLGCFALKASILS